MIDAYQAKIARLWKFNRTNVRIVGISNRSKFNEFIRANPTRFPAINCIDLFSSAESDVTDAASLMEGCLKGIQEALDRPNAITHFLNLDMLLLSLDKQHLQVFVGYLQNYHNKHGRVIIPVIHESNLWRALLQVVPNNTNFFVYGVTDASL